MPVLYMMYFFLVLDCYRQGIASNSETVYMTKGLVGGILSMVAFSYKAGFGNASSDLVDAAVLANIAAFSWWSVSGLNQLFNDKKAKKGLIGPKVDLGICAVMMTMFGSTFL